MNILTPGGIKSIEFRLDDGAAPEYKISDCLHLDEGDRDNKYGLRREKIMSSLLALAEVIVGKDCCGQVLPFEVVYNSDLRDMSLKITTN